MNKKHPDSKPLAAPEEALGFYLDSLLMDVPVELPGDETIPVAAVAPSADEKPATQKSALQRPSQQLPKKQSQAASQKPSQEATQKPRSEKAVAEKIATQKTAPEKYHRTRKTAPRVANFNTGAAAVVPLKAERRELKSRPFAEPRRPQALLSGPPLIPLLQQDAPVPVVSETAPLVNAPPVEKPALVEVPTAPAKPVPVAETPKEPPPPTDLPEAAAASRLTEQTDSKPAVTKEQRPAPQHGGVPDWAENSFQCLSFMVAGLTLAAPLERLNGIIEWHGEITELPGYASWFMGLQPNRGQNVRVIDTAQIIMPDGRRPDARPVLERVKYVVLIDDGRWGLAVDAIAQVLTLEPDGVRWRGERSKRPWLAGTAVEQMCAVLDIDSLSTQLRQGVNLDDDGELVGE